MTLVVPAIIPESFDAIQSNVDRVRSLVERVQIDVIDGLYAPTVTWPYNEEESSARLLEGGKALPYVEELQYEVDLMISRPEESIELWMATDFRALILHVESTKRLGDVISKIKMSGKELGLALKPSTPLEELAPYIEQADFVQCMGSDTIGFHGVELDPRIPSKLQELRRLYPELPLAVDIGVTGESAGALVQAGATKLVSGSYIFGSNDVESAVKRLSSLVP